LLDGGCEVVWVEVPGEVRHGAGVDRVRGDAVALSPAVRSLDRKQSVGGLRLSVGEHRIVWTRVEVEVVEVQGRS
jgi:hypothetical protein